jgi:hypothetical protein
MRNKILYKHDYYSCYGGSSFSLKSGLKCVPKKIFDFEFLILVLFQRPTSSKNGRSFHGEMVTFISVIDGITDIF